MTTKRTTTTKKTKAPVRKIATRLKKAGAKASRVGSVGRTALSKIKRRRAV